MDGKLNQLVEWIVKEKNDHGEEAQSSMQTRDWSVASYHQTMQIAYLRVLVKIREFWPEE